MDYTRFSPWSAKLATWYQRWFENAESSGGQHKKRLASFVPILKLPPTEGKTPPNAMHPSFLSAMLLVAISTCGCIQGTAGQLPGTVREATRQFSGKIGDLVGDGQTATINSECRGFERGPTDDGKYYAGFDLSPYNASNEFHLYCIFPSLAAGQVVVTNTESRIVDVWLFRSDKNYSNSVFVVKHDEEQMIRRGGQKMAGQVATKWTSDADFVIGVDVVLPKKNSTWARGEFVGSTKTKLNPLLWEWPAILIQRESK